MMTKSEATQLFRDATGRFIRQCRSADVAQWGIRPRPDAWSMGDVAEHVSIANRGIFNRLANSLLASPIAGNSDITDDEIPYLFYRGDEPPNVAKPSGTWTSWSETEAMFRQSATPILTWFDEVNVDLRSYGVPHPVFGLLDGMQWLLFAAAHTERHRAQLIGLQRAALTSAPSPSGRRSG